MSARALSSGGERFLDAEEVRGSNPLAPTRDAFLHSESDLSTGGCGALIRFLGQHVRPGERSGPSRNEPDGASMGDPVFTFRPQTQPYRVKDMQVEDAETEQGLELVYRDHGARLWRAVFAFAGDRQIADDAIAEAFAQALRRGNELRDPLAWIWRVAFRVAAGELKERHARQAAFIALHS
jgi:hypothetical protein